MTTTTIGPVTMTGNTPLRVQPLPGPYRWASVILYNLSGMPVLVGSNRWLAPFSADYFPWNYAQGYYDLQPLTLASANTGTLLATWSDPDSDPNRDSYPIPMPPGTVTVAPPPAGTFLTTDNPPFSVPDSVAVFTYTPGLSSVFGAYATLTASVGANALGYDLLGLAWSRFPNAAGAASGVFEWAEIAVGAVGSEVVIAELTWAYTPATIGDGDFFPIVPCPTIPPNTRVAFRAAVSLNRQDAADEYAIQVAPI